MKFKKIMSFIVQFPLIKQRLQTSKHEKIQGKGCFETLSELL